MLTAFGHAVDTLFADPHGSVAGVFTAPPAAGVSVRVLFTRHDPVVLDGFAGSGAQAPGWRAELRKAEVPTQPTDTCTLAVNGTTYRVRSVDQMNDPEALTWKCDLGAV